MSALDSIEHLPSQRFEPRVYGVGAWTDNVHFAYDLVAATKPRLLVELGTDRGESYFAFCQSAAENATGTRCCAVDTWRGDEQAGGYDETTFREVTQHNARRYAAFSTLLRCTFDAALERFAPGTIDLLHVDGFHTEEAVRHDLSGWLPKLRPGGILLMHDVAVRVRDFGVWKVWEELQEHGRSYTFSIGAGLGVWQKPPPAELPDPIETLLRGDAAAAAPVERYYHRRARELQDLIAEHWRDGTIRETAAAQQSIVQIFYSNDATHSEERSLLARIGHNEWRALSFTLPKGAGAAPLRIDFVSPFTTIDLALIGLTADREVVFSASEPAGFSRVEVAGDARRHDHAEFLRVEVTGLDPQLYLPPLTLPVDAGEVRLSLRLRVSAQAVE